MKYLWLSLLVFGCGTSPKSEEISYMQGIMPQIRIVWRKKLFEHVHDKEMKDLSTRSTNLTVKVLVDISKDGEVKKVVYLKASNISVIDQAAKEAFTGAGPFPRPPVSCLKEDVCQVRWDFIVEGGGIKDFQKSPSPNLM